MIQLRKSADRGHANHGWLDSKFSFSFADYYDSANMGFRALRVINEDVIQGGGGFGTHGHREMEIVTYVLDGGIAHKDSIGSVKTLIPGELQHMSAGTGIRHSEYNASATTSAHMLQIWLLPSKQGIAPTYDQKAFQVDNELNRLHLLASPEGREGSLTWATDADLYAGRFEADQSVTHTFQARKHGWIQLAKGSATANGLILNQGDGLALSDEPDLAIQAGTDGAEFLFFELG
jgi:redox-sensitive bicupin YhaK (pirin superfamily)